MSSVIVCSFPLASRVESCSVFSPSPPFVIISEYAFEAVSSIIMLSFPSSAFNCAFEVVSVTILVVDATTSASSFPSPRFTSAHASFVASSTLSSPFPVSSRKFSEPLEKITKSSFFSVPIIVVFTSPLVITTPAGCG